jgi:hypothetical protein
VLSKSLSDVADYEVLKHTIVVTTCQLGYTHGKFNMLIIYALFAELKSETCVLPHHAYFS